MKTNTRNIFLHIIGSIAFLSIPILSSPDINSGLKLFHINPFLNRFCSQFLLLTYFYLNYYNLLPNLYFNKKKVIFILITLSCLLLIYFIPDFLFSSNSQDNTRNLNIPPPPLNNFLISFLEKGVFQFLFVFFLSYFLKISFRFEEMKNEKQQAEISYLKAQINPHFLFNTLNSIYALTLLKSDEASKAVIKLSGIMRYVTTESSNEYVTLNKEINYIKDYIALQKLRLSSEVNFLFDINGDISNKKVAPLLLIPYIENAFKYGINPDEDSFIHIKINIFENELHLNVKNSIVHIAEIIEEKSEKGLENTENRLKILYPSKHQLTINENETIYEVDLKLFLI